jgi:hypothetical protein
VAQEATRRGVLATTALAAGLAASGLPLAGCKGIGALGTPPRPLPDVAVAARAIAAERALIAQYSAILTAMPSLAGQLRPLLAQHNEHLTRLRSRLSEPAGHPAATASSGTSTTAHRSAPLVPTTPAAALAALRTSENAASAALASQLASLSPSFAQLLASISASEATHARLLHPHGPGQ